MIIRPAREDEARVLSAIAYEAKAHWGYSPAQLEAWRPELTVAPETIARGDTHLAELDESGPIGFYVLEPAARHWTLEHFWVSPASMGRGVGRALLTHAVQVAATGGATALAIDSDPFAEGFYLACGAERVGAIPAPIEGEPERVRPQLVLAVEGKF